VCERLGIPHHLFNAEEAFERDVIQDFGAEYLSGRTPNPCVRCNERVKFGHLIKVAEKFGADYLATGHYARVEYDSNSNRYQLLKGVDETKDQSYFLYRLSQRQLSRVWFPLGDLKKEAVWKEAENLGLPADEIRESQEICFVTQKGYRGFIEERYPEALKTGEMVTADGKVLSHHRGLSMYTVGQRRGLGIPAGQRLYVTHLDPVKNQVLVGPEEALFQQELFAQDLNYVGISTFDSDVWVKAKIRYRTPEQSARVQSISENSFRLTFKSPQKAITPGQSVVLYDGDRVLAGGIIERGKGLRLTG
jgi:tRNA-specific 2-thiouridylase